MRLRPRRFRSLLLALLVGPCAVPALAATAVAPERLAVLLSIDGLRPASFTRPDELGPAVPNLRRLVAEGASAEGMVGVLPSVTYPSHTTMTTGLPPRRHGIAANRIFDPEGRSNEAWTWYAEDIRAPTLLTAARGRGLVTTNEEGEVASWRAFFHASAGSAALHLADAADEAARNIRPRPE